jgi:hypothetical protein
VQAEPQIPPRWYVVNNYGAATLCVDQEDADALALNSDRLFPREAPHVAVQLAPVRTLDAAPSEPSAECWRRAIADIFGPDMSATVERRARERAKEGK